MQIRSQPCQCPVCSVHPIFLGRPWLRCSLCHWLLRRWRRGYYWRRLKQWQRSEKINQFKKPLANYQIPQNACSAQVNSTNCFCFVISGPEILDDPVGFPPIFPFFTRTYCNYIWSGPARQSLRGKEAEARNATRQPAPCLMSFTGSTKKCFLLRMPYLFLFLTGWCKTVLAVTYESGYCKFG